MTLIAQRLKTLWTWLDQFRSHTDLCLSSGSCPLFWTPKDPGMCQCDEENAQQICITATPRSGARLRVWVTRTVGFVSVFFFGPFFSPCRGRSARCGVSFDVGRGSNSMTNEYSYRVIEHLYFVPLIGDGLYYFCELCVFPVRLLGVLKGPIV